MTLTDEQWHLIAPLLPKPSPFARGRPPFDSRLVMVGVLCKLLHAAPWYDLPDVYPAQTPAEDRPSWQTCYRAYRLWQRQGIMDQVYRLLYQDLRDRGGVDLFHLFEHGLINLNSSPSGVPEILLAEYHHTWQGTTIQLLTNVIFLRRKNPMPNEMSASTD